MLHAYRSQRVEWLIGELARVMRSNWPADPFVSVPVVVGSRGMERWLRHELATRLGSVARVDFLFPRVAFEGAAAWLLDPGPGASAGPVWTLSAKETGPWTGSAFAMRILAAIRQRQEEPLFARVRRYLGAPTEVVSARELSFAMEVAGALDRLLYDRPEQALAWVRKEPSTSKEPGEHAWLATLLTDLIATSGTASEESLSTAEQLERVRALSRPPSERSTGRPLFVFGLSALRPGDQAWLSALAPHFDVHLFMLAPSSAWWADIRSRVEARTALARAGRPEEVVALHEELDRQNPLLAANGAASRDVQVWLEDVGYQPGPEEPGPASPETLLARLQTWLDAAEDRPVPASEEGRGPWSSACARESIEVHACHGALRQCEALRDALLRRFAQDPTLEPRHVVVMTPDVATYAPLLAAVFGRKGDGVPAIPVHVADLGLRATNSVAAALLHALELADERVTASRLVEVLTLGPVRARFDLSDEDLLDLREMIAESGLRWAWNAADRARHEQPELDQNTVRFALERLALGTLMPDPGGFEVLPAAGQLGPAVPLELIARDRVVRFGKLAHVCAQLAGLRDVLERPGSPSDWRERMRATLDAITLVEDERAWLRTQVERTLDAQLVDAPGAPLTLDRTAVMALLRGAFEIPKKGDRPVTGAVTVCGMEPMRSVPFRVVALVGMDDGAFPRVSREPAWSPLARRQRGEHDRRALDRHCFLEALLCARDALLIFGTGFEPMRGERIPLSVVVAELLEVLAEGLGVEESQSLLIKHPLQPWSAMAFEDPTRLPFDPRWDAAAKALASRPVLRGVAATPLDATWPREEHPPAAVTADELARTLENAPRALLSGVLQLRLGHEDAELEDREPIEPGTLDSRSLRDRALAAMRDGARVEPAVIVDRFRAEGVLPLAQGGEEALRRELDAVESIARRVNELGRPGPTPAPVAYNVGGVDVRAVPTEVRLARAEDGGPEHEIHVWMVAGDAPQERVALLAWITLLVVCAHGSPVHGAVIVHRNETWTFAAPSTPRPILEALVACWREVRGRPSLLVPKFSRSVAEARQKHPDKSGSELLLQCRQYWEMLEHQRGSRPALNNAWVAALFGHLSVTDLIPRAVEIEALATSVWGPLLEAKALGSPVRRKKLPPKAVAEEVEA